MDFSLAPWTDFSEIILLNPSSKSESLSFEAATIIPLLLFSSSSDIPFYLLPFCVPSCKFTVLLELLSEQCRPKRALPLIQSP